MNLKKQLIHSQSMQVSCSKRLSEISCLSGFYASHRSARLSLSLSLSRVDVPRGTIPNLARGPNYCALPLRHLRYNPCGLTSLLKHPYRPFIIRIREGQVGPAFQRYTSPNKFLLIDRLFRPLAQNHVPARFEKRCARCNG